MTACAAALAFALRVYQQRSASIPLHVAAGLAVGLAVSARYNAAVIGVVTAFACLATWWKHRRVLPLVLGAGAALIGFIAGTPGAIFAARQFIDDVRYILNWYRAEGGGPGFTLDSGPLAIAYHWRYLILVGFGGPSALMAMWGLIRLISRPESRWIGAGFAMFIAAYSLTALTGARLNANLLLPLIPVLAVLAAYGLHGRGSGRWRVLVGAACLLWTGGAGGLVANRFTFEDTRLTAQAWVFQNLPNGARIHLLGSYNVPLDPTLYRTSQSYGGSLPEGDAGWQAAFIIYSDAFARAALRDPALTRNPADLAAIRATVARLQSEYRELVRFPRRVWIGEALPPDDFGMWHHPEIVVYCRPAACP
jgi:hypothetical protein